MIQRIQTLWLLISALAPLYFIKGQIVKFQNDSMSFYGIGFKGIVLSNSDKVELLQPSIAIPAAIILIFITSLVAVFLYRRRNIQKILALASFAFSAGLLIITVYHSWNIIREYEAAIKFVPGLILLPLLCITTILAFRGISRDEELVRSYDRLR